ncbi:hypothetical protein LTR36_002687 [Oleoguttula mirabilis]|uniref:Uncharacterized protein n=1 Tax=Oleoguttula mirabilis TaxID=1507867 RepID=A0AAV9JL68_9PEZI|nr:hypothetical protein LTR36_002687 [Oleoguttula mirabilis]
MTNQPIAGVPYPYARIALAAQRKAISTVIIYHSCDPPGTRYLRHYKKGKYTPSTGYDADYPTEHVQVPRRYGNREVVLRCARGQGCLECMLTEYESSDLSLSVAKAHGIRGAYIRPSPAAKTVQAKIKDGEERGKWMSLAPTPAELTSQALETPEFHPLAATGTFARVLKWLKDIPAEAELRSSAPLFARNPEAAATTETSLHVPGLGRRDTLGVGAEFFDPRIKVEPSHERKAQQVGKTVAHPQSTVTSGAYAASRGHQLDGGAAESSRLKTKYELPENSDSALHPQYLYAESPARAPVYTTAFTSVNPQFGVQLVRPYPEYSAPLAPAVPRLSEKRMMEDAGAVAQSRRKRARYGLGGMLYGS